MAEAATRSPHRNPNSRSSEIDNPMRRSFGGNPFSKPSISTKQRGLNPVTPANSPSDFTRRSVPSLLRDHEDKENGREHDPKQARLRSPSVQKGTKHFMSPTISAASKIAASPKKKILAEKNEPSDGKASVSFSDVLEFIDPQPETGKASVSFSDVVEFIDEPQPETDMDHVSTPLIEKAQCTPVKDSGFCPGSRVSAEDCVNLDWSSIGSIPDQDLEADPVAPPYDPETNFTSPRPQFLRYRPNPRIEEYLGRERRGDCLEDSFTSESSSDAELTEETETQSEDSPGDSEDVSSAEMVNDEETETQSEDSLRDSEDVSSAVIVNGELMKEEVSCEMAEEVSGEAMQAEEAEEVSDDEQLVHGFESTKEAAKEKRVSKLHCLKRPKTGIFLLMLLLACLSVSVTDPPTLGLLLKDTSYSNLHLPTEFTEYDVKASLDSLSQSFELWYGKSISYFSELVSAREPKLGSLKYINLTALYDDRYLVDGYISKRELQDNVLEENDEEAFLGHENVDVPAAEVHEVSEFEVHDNNKGVEENNILQTENVEVPDVPAAEVDEESEFIEKHNILETDVGEVPAAEVHEEPEFEVHDINKGVEEHNILETEKAEVPDVPAAEIHEESEFEAHDSDDKGATELNIIETESSETNSLEAETFQETNSESSMETNLEAETFQESKDSAALNTETNSESSMEAPAELSDPLEKIESTEAEDSSAENSKSDSSAGGTESSETTLALDWLKDEILKLKDHALGIAVLFLALLAAITALLLRTKEQNKPALLSTAPIIPEDDQVLTKKPDISPKPASSAIVEHSFEERLSSSRYSPMEIDMVGESAWCPSGTSSFQKSSYYSEAQSQDKDRKGKKKYSSNRESMASSSDDYSVGSIASYGSFTTYEKISAKRVNGEEITPVRRSSRIRKQVMSP